MDLYEAIATLHDAARLYADRLEADAETEASSYALDQIDEALGVAKEFLGVLRHSTNVDDGFITSPDAGAFRGSEAAET